LVVVTTHYTADVVLYYLKASLQKYKNCD